MNSDRFVNILVIQIIHLQRKNLLKIFKKLSYKYESENAYYQNPKKTLQITSLIKRKLYQTALRHKSLLVINVGK